jgi:alpha-ketoglutarate-dependent taurine dioxygenase
MTAGPGFRGARRVPVADATATVEAVAGPGLPLQVRPRGGADLASWARAHRGTVTGWLDRHGAVLFRGFAVVGLDAFADVAGALAGPAVAHLERSTPRTRLAPDVYTSTDYPADQHIPPHNEDSYRRDPPARLVFGCRVPAATGGSTVLADCRAVLARIDPAVVATFRARGVAYRRTYHPGLGPSWQEAFQTADPRAVDTYCRERGIATRWHGSTLSTWQPGPAVVTHARTGEDVWFNHAAMFHVSRLGPDLAAALLAQYGDDLLPTQSSHADGTPLDPAALAGIREAYAAESVPVRWEAGDVLLVDNVLVAHGREPYTGRREVVVSMAGSAGEPRPSSPSSPEEHG